MAEFFLQMLCCKFLYVFESNVDYLEEWYGVCGDGVSWCAYIAWLQLALSLRKRGKAAADRL